MREQLFEILRRASLFVIAAHALLPFCPQERYEKYLNWFVCLMTFALLFFPLLQLFSSGRSGTLADELTEYDIQIRQLMKDPPEWPSLDETAYLSTISDEIKTRINRLQEETGYAVKSVEIRRFPASGANGAQSGKTLKIVVERAQTGISTTPVDKIKCGINGDDRTSTAVDPAAEGEIASELCGRYAALLGMEEKEVEVVVDGT